MNLKIEKTANNREHTMQKCTHYAPRRRHYNISSVCKCIRLALDCIICLNFEHTVD